MSNMNQRAKYVMIGGFLGAGKSSAVIKFADYLKGKDHSIGLITNDQSVGLVDTATMRAKGYDVEEIAGGCFCCRFNSLVEAANKLKQGEVSPEYFIAEPVGSCTDLVATVSYPLRRMYGDSYEIAPLSVLVDPIRCSRVLGLDGGKSFSEKVVYVYQKQLEEADIIVINKVDLVDAGYLEQLKTALREAYPEKEVIAVSVKSGEGLENWFELMESGEISPGLAMPIDYQVYAEGEALLGWLNATVQVSCDRPFDGEVLMMDLAEYVQQRLNEQDAEVAHLKMTMMPDSQGGRVATLNLVRNDYVPELAQSLPEQMSRGTLIVNLRAEADPGLLNEILVEGLSKVQDQHQQVKLELEDVDYFQPAPPEPTHRIEDALQAG